MQLFFVPDTTSRDPTPPLKVCKTSFAQNSGKGGHPSQKCVKLVLHIFVGGAPLPWKCVKLQLREDLGWWSSNEASEATEATLLKVVANTVACVRCTQVMRVRIDGGVV